MSISEPHASTFGRFTILPPEDGPPDDSIVPQALPRFQPIAELGKGAVGQVVAARDLDIGRRVAIKRLLPERRSQGNFVRFLQEVRTAGQLEHPNIIPIHDIGREEDGNYYIVMKYVDGETLESILSKLAAGDRETHAKWGFEQRIDIFMAVLQAVRFAHDNGILHRDIKPSNIMVGNHGEVQLLDWGIAKRKADRAHSPLANTWIGEGSLSGSATETKTGAIVGTPLYMSPEQARGAPADERSETYTLSLLLYEMLSLNNPRARFENISEMLEAIQREAPPLVSKEKIHPLQGPIPIELCWFVSDGLSLDPAKRHPDVSSMIDFLTRRSNGEIDVRCSGTFKKLVAMKTIRFIDRHPLSSWLLFILPVIGTVASVAMLVGSVVALLASAGLVWLS